VNIVADKTTPGSLGAVGYDDEGVKCKRWDIIKDGILVNYQATRDQAHIIGEKESHGCSYADSWSNVQFQRMPNVSLAAGKKKMTPDEMVKDIKKGIYIVGDGSFSIDQQRYNFQFGGQLFYEINNGKIGQMLEDVAYQSNTQEFWNACTASATSATGAWAAPSSTARASRRRSPSCRTAPPPRASTASTSSTPPARSAKAGSTPHDHPDPGTNQTYLRPRAVAVQGRRVQRHRERQPQGQYPLRAQRRLHRRPAEDTNIAVRSPSANARAPPPSTSSTTSRWKKPCAAPKTWRLAPENPEFMPAVAKQKYKASRPSRRPPTSIRNSAPRSAAYAIEACRKNKLVAAGFFTDSTSFTSRRQFERRVRPPGRTGLDFTCTVRTEDGRGSGWVKRSAGDAERFDPREAADVAIEKALRSVDAKALEPGRYTVILEPAATSDCWLHAQRLRRPPGRRRPQLPVEKGRRLTAWATSCSTARSTSGPTRGTRTCRCCRGTPRTMLARERRTSSRTARSTP
jgi:predicted Zn-dependent protease